MSTITIGKILTSKEDTYRELLRSALAPIRWRGYATGRYAVEVCEGLVLQIELNARDISILAQLDELLGRIVAANQDAIAAYTGCYEEEAQERVGWFALAPVRNVGYGEGEYTVKLRGGVAIELTIGRWDAMLLRRYDELLRRLAIRNRRWLQLWQEPSSAERTERAA